MYDPAAHVEAVNGRGGDDGIDIKVTQDSQVHVFQLKYYPDGFPTTAHKGRRTSIRQSFARAMRCGSQEWVLMVPCVLTAHERQFVMSLAVEVEVWHRAKLDDLLAAHSDVGVVHPRSAVQGSEGVRAGAGTAHGGAWTM
ncbi:hypothetical protein [Streptomyces sp. NPDC006285]|uniref:hypothetical protein n=1 Tax=Streptomyces sp. NPDC006285 TaxID=3364742 RepID=UPI0036A7987F